MRLPAPILALVICLLLSAINCTAQNADQDPDHALLSRIVCKMDLSYGARQPFKTMFVGSRRRLSETNQYGDWNRDWHRDGDWSGDAPPNRRWDRHAPAEGQPQPGLH